MSAEPLLSIRDLCVRFRGESGWMTAIDEVGFDLAQGEALGIVGESGSGKSVTALSILGLHARANTRIPTGQILYAGNDLLRAPERELRRIRGAEIAMIFQDPMSSLNPVLSVILISHDLGVIAEFARRVLVMYAGRVVEEAPVRDIFRAPLHPYTDGLLAAVPRLDADMRRLPAIPGNIPDPGDRIPGCRLSPRCAEARPECRATPPALLPAGPGRLARCPPRVAGSRA